MTTKPPTHLQTDGAAFWREIVREYAITDPGGLALVTRAAECLDRMAAARKAIAEHGEITLDRYGCPKVNPACLLERDARNGFLAALKPLGLDLEPVRDRPGRPAGA